MSHAINLLVAAFLVVVALTSALYSAEYQGFGAATPGGSGQPVYRVTNLRDSGPGSLRDAVSRGRRYIVFDVKGEINLSSRIHVRGSYITIDGFTAGHPGITLKGWGLYMWGNDGAHNLIIRGIRVRNSAGDGLHVSKGAHDIVIDRSSVALAGDGNIDITEGAYNVTVSRTILAEPAAGNKNMLIMYDSPRRITLHHNLFIKAESRSPQVQTDGLGTPATDTTVDMRNNIIWDWRGGYGTRLRYGPRVNVINNYYAANGGDARDALIVCPGSECDDSNPASAARVYAQGNISAEGINLNARGNEKAAFPSAPVDTQDAKSGACEVLDSVGVRPVDTLDQQYLSMVSLPWCSGGGNLPPAPIPPPPAPIPPPQSGNYRVNTGGGSYTDGDGKQWSADQAYRTGGWGYSGGASYGRAASIAKTADDVLYQTERYGNFSYRFDVANGKYDVTLHFAEIYWNGSGERKFTVSLEGQPVLNNFDIVAVAGSRTAVSRTFSAIAVSDGRLDIDFIATKDNAKISAISLIKSNNSPTPAPSPQPGNYSQRVNGGGGSYTDAEGKQWSADQAYRAGSWGHLGGSSYRGSASIANTADDFLYQTERHGNFSYLFDVPNGVYDVTLRFAEIYWNGPDQRIFTVRIEAGAAVLDRYDIYAINGKNHAISMTFSGIRVADGQLNINFVTVKDNAKVSAIWVRRQ